MSPGATAPEGEKRRWAGWVNRTRTPGRAHLRGRMRAAEQVRATGFQAFPEVSCSARRSALGALPDALPASYKVNITLPDPTSKRRFYGIDFSGAAAPWKARCGRPTVWIATIEDAVTRRLIDLRPVQNLAGTGEPFERLVRLLRAGDYQAAAIDAPFSIPAEYLPPEGHAELLDLVRRLPPAPDRPFPNGGALVELADGIKPRLTKKPYRHTEQCWIKRQVNTRSTLWAGPRGGAAFTVACLTLIALSERPIWPWDHAPGMLVEAFPAAQLRCLDLPYVAYGKPEQFAARERILTGLTGLIEFASSDRTVMIKSADALDAVVAAFAAIAAFQNGPDQAKPADGLIAVLDDRLSSFTVPDR